MQGGAVVKFSRGPGPCDCAQGDSHRGQRHCAGPGPCDCAQGDTAERAGGAACGGAAALCRAWTLRLRAG